MEISIVDSILVAAFCLSMVFGVLACLYGLIRLFSIGINAIAEKATNVEAVQVAEPSVSVPAETVTGGDFSTGELKLYDVDEPTAAMVMAIVSDEAGIPLSELCFKSIRELKEENK